MQMVNDLSRAESRRGEAFGIEGYTEGRPAYERPTIPPGTVRAQMQVIGLVAQQTPSGPILIRTFLTNVPPTGG